MLPFLTVVRKLNSVTGDILSQEKLPDKLIGRCLDVLRQLSSDEKDLIRIVVEVIQNLRDPGDEDEQPVPSVCLPFMGLD